MVVLYPLFYACVCDVVKMKKLIFTIVLFNAVMALYSQNYQYGKEEVVKILREYTRLSHKNNILWFKAQKDSLYMEKYRDFCKADSLNIFDTKYKMHKVYDMASKYIIENADTTIMIAYLKLLYESENSAEEHLRYITGKILLKKTEMAAMCFRKQNKQHQKVIYLELLKGIDYISYEKPIEKELKNAKDILRSIKPK